MAAINYTDRFLFSQYYSFDLCCIIMACTLSLRVIIRYFAKAVMHNNGSMGGTTCGNHRE